MRDRCRFFALFVVAALAISAVGSGGFTTTSADRSVTVDVVGDENAYMDLEYDETTQRIEEGEKTTFVTVQNNFAEDDVEMTVSPDLESADSTLEPTWDQREGTIDGGESLESTVEFSCTNASADGTVDVTVAFDVSADGDGVHAETTAERTVAVDVTCVPE